MKIVIEGFTTLIERVNEIILLSKVIHSKFCFELKTFFNILFTELSFFGKLFNSLMHYLGLFALNGLRIIYMLIQFLFYGCDIFFPFGLLNHKCVLDDAPPLVDEAKSLLIILSNVLKSLHNRNYNNSK